MTPNHVQNIHMKLILITNLIAATNWQFYFFTNMAQLGSSQYIIILIYSHRSLSVALGCSTIKTHGLPTVSTQSPAASPPNRRIQITGLFIYFTETYCVDILLYSMAIITRMTKIITFFHLASMWV